MRLVAVGKSYFLFCRLLNFLLWSFHRSVLLRRYLAVLDVAAEALTLFLLLHLERVDINRLGVRANLVWFRIREKLIGVLIHIQVIRNIKRVRNLDLLLEAILMLLVKYLCQRLRGHFIFIINAQILMVVKGVVRPVQAFIFFLLFVKIRRELDHIGELGCVLADLRIRFYVTLRNLSGSFILVLRWIFMKVFV